MARFTEDDIRGAVDGARIGLWNWDIRSGKVLLSSHLGDIYGLEPNSHPVDIAEFSALLPQSFNLQTEILKALDETSGRFEIEHQIRCRDGSIGWVRDSGRVEFDEQRRPARLVAIVVDITKQKQSEKSLQTKEEQFRQFSALTSDYIYEVDMTASPLVPCVVAGSYERVVGYTDAELKEKGGWTAIMHSEDLKAGAKVYEQLRLGVPTVHEYRITNKLGQTRWLRDHCGPVLVDGKLTRIVGGVKDITETKVLETSLRQAQKHEALANLAGAVAHDFNNLLLVVMASTEMISTDAKDDDLDELKSGILVACERATELTRSLLAFTSQDLPKTRTIRLSSAVHEIGNVLQRAIGGKIELVINNSSDLNDKVDIDPGHLQLVLLNMATNARDAMRGCGSLCISVSDVDSEKVGLPDLSGRAAVVLEVTDTGCGIAPENLQKVFEPFFTMKSAGVGFGIGLGTCWQVIDRAGGTIHVKSRLGHGTTFSIYLPTVDKELDEETPSTGTFLCGGNERILVVEDNPDVRRVSVRALQSYGYDVSAVDCVQAARLAVADEKFDLMVVDVRLPDGDGCSLVGELQESDPKLSALLVSGYINEAVRTRIRHDGHAVLPKPYSTAALARSVRTALHPARKP